MSDRVWRHVISEGESPLWRHGRAYITFRQAGRRTPHSPNRQDLEFGTEWRLLVPQGKGFGVGATFKWGTNASETTPDISVHLSRLGDLWLHAGGMLPYRWLERRTADGKVDYDTRTFEVRVDSTGFRWECWARDMHWSKSDPWWMRRSYQWRQVFFGRETVTTTLVDDGTCTVPLPEKNYPAVWKVTRYERHLSSPLGRLRDWLLGPRFNYRTDIEPGVPVPVPGKGENSWDVDDDAIFSMSIGGRNVEAAIAAVVEDALKTRRRHGGQHMSVPGGTE